MSCDRDSTDLRPQDSLGQILKEAGLRTARLIAYKLEPPQPPAPSPSGVFAPGTDLYETLYESHVQSEGDETVVGDLALGPIELEILQDCGLEPNHTLLDLGCGIGRLACVVVPWLEAAGAYIGTDVSPTMLARAERRLAETVAQPACSVRLLKQEGNAFPLEPGSVDMVCAFSVFTHIEHEDAYALLQDARRIIRPGGRFVFSCLPLDIHDARYHFWSSAQRSLAERWSSVRNVTTTVDLMDKISAMAGWEPESWVPGDPKRFGQSVCTLKPIPEELIARRANPWDV